MLIRLLTLFTLITSLIGAVAAPQQFVWWVLLTLSLVVSFFLPAKGGNKAQALKESRSSIPWYASPLPYLLIIVFVIIMAFLLK